MRRQFRPKESPEQPIKVAGLIKGKNDTMPNDITTIDTSRNREELAQPAQRLIKAPDVFEEFARDMEAGGFAGDKRHAQLAFTVGTSRLLKEPMSLFIKGPSSSGKSRLLNSVLGFFPEEAYELKSGISPKAIAYGGSDLRHRIFAVQEMVGLNSPDGNPLIRTLISEKRITWEVTERKGDQFTTRTIERDGPIAFMLTTTLTYTHGEDESRALTIEISDTPEHTRLVLTKIAEHVSGNKNDDVVDREEYHSYQRWLALGPTVVVVPFGSLLAATFNSRANRAKRDFWQLMSAIQVSALLHQYNRTVDERGRIVAALDDYRMVREFLAPAINEATGATIPPAIQETVEAILALGGNGVGKSDLAGVPGPTLAALREKLGDIDRSSVSRRVNRAKELGYVTDLTKGNGHPSNLIVIQALPKDKDVLPMVEELTQEAHTLQTA